MATSLAVSPPLTVTPEHLDLVADALGRALEDVAAPAHAGA
jgi:adenosylmethionine-8-amino-7-oxononanoate aminotransferase